MQAYLLRTILPRLGLYATCRGTPVRRPGLDTIPRVPPPVLGDYDRILTREDILKGLNYSKHYGLVRELSPEYRRWLLSYFNPWAAAWLSASVYMWWAQTYTESGGGGGSLPWIRSIITADNRSAEDEVHEAGHFWEEAKVNEGLWTPQSFTGLFKAQVGMFRNESDRSWARAFLVDPLGKDPEAYNETYASTASRVMGNLDLLPVLLRPYFEPLFHR